MLWKESFEKTRDRINEQLGYGKLLRLARLTGTGVEHLAKAWKGKRSLSFTTAYRVAKAANISMEDLYKTICAPKGSFCRKELHLAEMQRRKRLRDVQYWNRQQKQLAKIAMQMKRTPTR